MKTSLKVIHAFVLTVADSSLERKKSNIATHLLTHKLQRVKKISSLLYLHLNFPYF